MEIVVAAIVPIVLSRLLGYVAGWHHDETPTTAKAINVMVLHYSLPLALFAATVATPRAELLKQGPLALILFMGMVVPFALAFAACYKVSGGDMSASVLQALGFGFPAIPFVGVAVLTPLIGSAAVIVVAVGGCIINLILVPISFVLLSLSGQKDAPPVKGGAGPCQPHHEHDGSGEALPEKADPPKPGIGAVILSSLKEPVMWAPVGGLLLVLSGVPIPKLVMGALQFLDSTSGAVSLFASGIILQAQKPTISWPVAISALGRNLLIPGAALLIPGALGVDHDLRKTAVPALALPAAAMQITLALRYQTNERENASLSPVLERLLYPDGGGPEFLSGVTFQEPLRTRPDAAHSIQGRRSAWTQQERPRSRLPRPLGESRPGRPR